MARRKPLDQLSPAYRRRIERAEARGQSRQEARGHGRPAAAGGRSEYQTRRDNRLRRLFIMYEDRAPEFSLAELVENLGYARTEQFLKYRNIALVESIRPEHEQLSPIAREAYRQMVRIVQDARSDVNDQNYWYYYH